MPKFLRKIIRVEGEKSPNVRYAQWEISQGRKPSNKVIVPGVLSWEEYCIRRKTWDPYRQCVCLDAQFYKGAELLLFPREWLSRAERIATSLSNYTIPLHDRTGERSGPCWMGIDSAMGGDSTVWCIGDEKGLLKIVSMKTPDTSVITGITLGLMREFKIPSENVGFDQGGGGKDHADRLRLQGYNVDTVWFGDITRDDHDYATPEEEQDVLEQKRQYKNRRAQLYGQASKLLDPTPLLQSDCATEVEPVGYGIPNTEEYKELIRQLSLMPKLYNEEGRLYLPSKNKRDSKDTKVTLKEIVGRSPDEADAFVVMVHMMLKPKTTPTFILANTLMKKPEPKKTPDFIPIRNGWYTN